MSTRILIFIVAYNHEKSIRHVLSRIPESLTRYDTEVLIIDDSSKDRTFEESLEHSSDEEFPFTLTTLFNPDNLGYGGNQKLGFHYAIKNNFDIVALVHGDGQYAPEKLPNLLEPLINEEADAVFGSRMIEPLGALRGGMPYYKFVGNKILTTYQNMLLGSNLSEFHSGYRVYTTNALKEIPFHLNTNDFHFDTEIIIQLLLAGSSIKEVPIPTYYGDEICNVDGLRYAFDVFKATLFARLQLHCLLYDRKYDVQPNSQVTSPYSAKLSFTSSHTLAVKAVKDNARVLDIGCAGGYLSTTLKQKGCHITGIDQFPGGNRSELDVFIEANLDSDPIPVSFEEFDTVLMLDIIEHLEDPERFVEHFATKAHTNPDLKLVITTGNIAFIIVRFMLLLGSFNYGKRGILDLTHKRLFTFKSLRRLFEQQGFEIVDERGIPAPFPLAVGNNLVGRFLLKINEWAILLSKNLFAYQIYMHVKPLPSLEYLLDKAVKASDTRRSQIE